MVELLRASSKGPEFFHARSFVLRQNLLTDFSMDVGEAKVSALDTVEARVSLARKPCENVDRCFRVFDRGADVFKPRLTVEAFGICSESDLYLALGRDVELGDLESVERRGNDRSRQKEESGKHA